MGVTCLGQPRKRVEYMKKNSDPESRYQPSHLLKIDKREGQSVAGQAQGKKVKVKLSLLTCSICMQTYNITTREPQLVCPNNHTYCKQCATQSFNTSRRCPECRADMRNPLIRNRDIFQLVEDNQQIIQQNKLEPVVQQAKQSEEIHITVDCNNKCINSFWVQNNRIMKIGNDKVWEGFTSNEILHRDRESTYTVRVVYSQFNNIELGIVAQGYKVQPNITCKEAVVYHLADGRILQRTRGQGSQWKEQGVRYEHKSGTSGILTVRVNPIEHRVTWLQGDKILGQGRFSQFLKGKQFVAYILLCHKEDVIQLNP